MEYGSSISPKSMKAIAESIGDNSLSDNAAEELAKDISTKLKLILQDAAKFMYQSKQQTLSLRDIDMSLQEHNVEPQCELNIAEDKDIELNESVKIPRDMTLRSHWFVVDGIQTSVPENPAPLSKDSQYLDSANPVIIHKLKSLETKDNKQLATH